MNLSGLKKDVIIDLTSDTPKSDGKNDVLFVQKMFCVDKSTSSESSQIRATKQLNDSLFRRLDNASSRNMVKFCSNVDATSGVIDLGNQKFVLDDTLKEALKTNGSVVLFVNKSKTGEITPAPAPNIISLPTSMLPNQQTVGTTDNTVQKMPQLCESTPNLTLGSNFVLGSGTNTAKEIPQMKKQIVFNTKSTTQTPLLPSGNMKNDKKKLLATTSQATKATLISFLKDQKIKNSSTDIPKKLEISTISTNSLAVSDDKLRNIAPVHTVSKEAVKGSYIHNIPSQPETSKSGCKDLTGINISPIIRESRRKQKHTIFPQARRNAVISVKSKFNSQKSKTPTILAKPPTILAKPTTILAKPTTILAKPPTILAKPPSLSLIPKTTPASNIRYTSLIVQPSGSPAQNYMQSTSTVQTFPSNNKFSLISTSNKIPSNPVQNLTTSTPKTFATTTHGNNIFNEQQSKLTNNSRYFTTIASPALFSKSFPVITTNATTSETQFIQPQSNFVFVNNTLSYIQETTQPQKSPKTKPAILKQTQESKQKLVGSLSEDKYNNSNQTKTKTASPLNQSSLSQIQNSSTPTVSANCKKLGSEIVEVESQQSSLKVQEIRNPISPVKIIDVERGDPLSCHEAETLLSGFVIPVDINKILRKNVTKISPRCVTAKSASKIYKKGFSSAEQVSSTCLIELQQIIKSEEELIAEMTKSIRTSRSCTQPTSNKVIQKNVEPSIQIKEELVEEDDELLDDLVVVEQGSNEIHFGLSQYVSNVTSNLPEKSVQNAKKNRLLKKQEQALELIRRGLEIMKNLQHDPSDLNVPARRKNGRIVVKRRKQRGSELTARKLSTLKSPKISKLAEILKGRKSRNLQAAQTGNRDSSEPKRSRGRPRKIKSVGKISKRNIIENEVNISEKEKLTSDYDDFSRPESPSITSVDNELLMVRKVDILNSNFKPKRIFINR